MRADRLLAILLILQRGGRVTAGDLARRLEVSERTIYRDVEALGAAGIPVYAEPGRTGGIRILGGFRTDLTGLSAAEAELLPLLGLSDVFAGLDVAPSLRRTQDKVLAALPEEQRTRAERSRRRIYVDLSRWWDHTEAVPHLAVIVEALFGGRRLRMRYRRGGDGAIVRRLVDPFGLVVQGGVWYLVARVRRRDVRTYRVSRVLAASVTSEAAELPDDFDLASFWVARKEDFHRSRPGYRAELRAVPSAVRALATGHHGESLAVVGDDEEGWQRVTFTFESYWGALERALSLGPRVEVLAPDELRAAVAEAASAVAALYR